MSRPQWRLLFQGGLGYTFDGMDAALVAFILPSATEVFSLSSAQTGLLVHLQERFWVMSCSGAYELAQRSHEAFRRCS
jgi:hypothetical protein